MSYKEAIEDKIPISTTSQGFKQYHPNCIYCGCSVASWNYLRNVKYVCDMCKILHYQDKVSKASDARETKLQNALKRIHEKSKSKKYDEVADKIREGFKDLQAYQSTEEIMVGLELLKKGIKFEHQVKILTYRADFVLPDLKVILEIDGPVHHNEQTKEYERIRDNMMMNAYDGYVVLRIKTKYINMNITRLVSGIKALKKYKLEHQHAKNGSSVRIH